MKVLNKEEIQNLPIKERQKYKREYRNFLLYSNEILKLSPLEYINFIENKLGERSLYKNKHVQDYLTKKYINNQIANSYKEAIFIIKNQITEKPRCQNCNKPTRFKKEENRYLSTCSTKCSNKINSQGKVEGNKKSFIKRKLPKFLKIYNAELLEDFKTFREPHRCRCLKCGNEFTMNVLTNGIICRECTPKIAGFSKEEKEVLDYIKEIYKGKILENDRSLGVEIDIYLPEIKLGIEYNGLYWHSSVHKDKNFHLNKTETCEKNNVQLIHIFANEWLEKKEIVKSILRSKMGLNKDKIFARKCEIREVPSKESNNFLEENHIQGKDNSPHRFGLYYKNKLVQLLTLKRTHRSKTKYLELKRSCTILNTSVVGGFSKLLKHTKNIFNEDIITFADRRYSSKDNAYNKIGELIDTIKPNHFYIEGLTLVSREKYQKHKLKDIFENYDPELTAIENCHINGIFQIYDCGNYKYLL